MSQIEDGTSQCKGEEEDVKGEGEEVVGEVGKGMEEGEGRKVEGRSEYGGGRFAGVGDFEPAVQRVTKKRKVTLPLFKCKPEATLRQV